MGSPLSPVAACLYMETLEDSHFFDIIGRDSLWLRYVDDVLVVVPKETDLNDILEQLNAVNEKLQFTLEQEQNEQLAFFDTHIIRTETGFKFKIYRKKTNKEDYVHFYSNHNERVKSGIVIGFFPRAFRICGDEFLQSEIEHINDSFIKLKYPKGYLIKQRQKAERIRSRTTRPDQDRRN